MPFVVANYVPNPEEIRSSSKGNALGLDLRRTQLRVVSKTPIRAMDDRACLRYLDLSDSEEEEQHHENWREKHHVSRKFYRN